MRKKAVVAADAPTERVKLSPTQIIQEALALPANHRDKLIAALLEAQTPSPHYAVLREALVREGKFNVSCTPGSAMHKHLITICGKMGEMGFGTGSPREEFAVLVFVVNGAIKQLERMGRSSTAPGVASILAEASWHDLIDSAFPGYGTRLLGGILCKQVLSTTPPSLPRTALPTPREAPT